MFHDLKQKGMEENMTKLYKQFLDFTANDIINIIKEQELYTPGKLKKYFHNVYDLSDEEIWCKQENKCITLEIGSGYCNNIYKGTMMRFYIDKDNSYNYNRITLSYETREFYNS